MGKPVSSWKTIVTKTAAIAGGACSVASVALGALAFAKRGKVVDMMGGMGHNTDARAVAIGSVSSMIMGLLGGVASKTTWDSASSASRTRNYLKLSEQLNSKETATQR